MAVFKIAVLLLALLGAASAQRAREPPKVTICYPIGNNTHATTTEYAPNLEEYHMIGYVIGKCTRVCNTICADFPSRIVNTTISQCTCVGKELKCGANAKKTNDKKNCRCLAGFKGDAIEGCVDIDECAAKKPACPASKVCVNAPGSFLCQEQKCGANAEKINGKCQCKAGYSGDAIRGCDDVDECSLVGVPTAASCPKGQGCVNTEGSYYCKACGANAGQKRGCLCNEGFVGDGFQGCVDIDECESFPWDGPICPDNLGCINVAGTFNCDHCGANAQVIWPSTRCECNEGFGGKPYEGCTQIP